MVTLGYCRKDTWTLLHYLSDSKVGHWLWFGDFNQILANLEKMGGRWHLTWQMQAFRSVIDNYQLRGVTIEGSPFTWSNMREGFANIREKLDRFLGNCKWFDWYPSNCVQIILNFVSNYSCLLLNIDGLPIDAPLQMRLFHFEAMWMGAKGCEENIA